MELLKQQIDEQELVNACRAGKMWAQKLVYELHAPVMLGVCVRYIGNRETARDLLQDGFIKVFTKIDSFSGTGSFEGWIRRIFVSTALEFLRRKDVLREPESIDNIYISDVDVSIIERISANDLMNLVMQLPPGYRTVFNLYAIEGYTHAEIAEMMQISENTSRSQFMRARKLLQKQIEKNFI